MADVCFEIKQIDMEKIKKAVVYGLIVTTLINGFGFFINVNLNGLDEAIKDILYLGPMTISIFFVPCFFSALYYKKDTFKYFKTSLKPIIKPALISFAIIYILVFIYMNFQKGFKLHYLYRTSLPNAVLTMLISVFSSLILFLIRNSSKTKNKNLTLNPLIIFIIWVVITVVYLLLHVVFGHGISGKNYRILILPVFGLLAALSSYKTIKLNLKINKSVILFSALYFFNCAVVLLLYMFSVVEIDKYSSERLVNLFFQGLIIFSPYFLLITLAVHVYYIQLKNKQEKKHLKQIGFEASLKYQQLKSQISPHFLFNNISVLTGLIEEDQEKAVRFSEDLSKVYRYFLDQETQDLVTLEDELCFAKKYINLLKVRFENALIFNNNTADIHNYYILPMALQQVFENVVKHNELSAENPMVIAMCVENEFLIISNALAPKLSIENKNPTGIENIKNRYAYFTDEKVVIIKTNTLFTIKLPLLKPEA